jgi:hypothetical protein
MKKPFSQRKISIGTAYLITLAVSLGILSLFY